MTILCKKKMLLQLAFFGSLAGRRDLRWRSQDGYRRGSSIPASGILHRWIDIGSWSGYSRADGHGPDYLAHRDCDILCRSSHVSLSDDDQGHSLELKSKRFEMLGRGI